jgi:antitoxin ParD1/3/4
MPDARILMDPQNAEKLSITLPPEMARMIREKVSSGAYGSNSEVIREALRGWLDRDRRLAALDSAIARGVADAEAGRVHGIDDVRAEVRARSAKKG